jgi:hypothetical protein
METAGAGRPLICIVQAMYAKSMFPTLVAAIGVALIGVAIGGCGTSDTTSAVGSKSSKATGSEYVEVLHALRDAAESAKSYDAYGFAEYMPSTQRAAIDAFCFLADEAWKNPQAASQGDPARLIQGITRKAESDLKSERDIVAPGPTRRAIAKLQAVLGLESLDRDLARRYRTGCYR